MFSFGIVILTKRGRDYDKNWLNTCANILSYRWKEALPRDKNIMHEIRLFFLTKPFYGFSI